MTTNPLDQLRKLGELRSEGIVSEAEFSAKKAELLRQVGASGNDQHASAGFAADPIQSVTTSAPPPLPTVSAAQVEAAGAEMEAVRGAVLGIQSAADKLQIDLIRVQSKVKVATRLLRVRDLSDQFPLGRFGALVLVPTAAGGLGAVLGVSIRLSFFATTWLTLLCGLAGIAGFYALVFWRSDDEVFCRQLEGQRAAENVSQLLTQANHKVTLARAVFDAAKTRYEQLMAVFQSRRNRLLSTDWRCMRGIPFEEFLCEVFRELGFQCDLTKASGDQGVDLIAMRGGLRIAIQAKGYAESVGNKAVQEAHAGMTFYNCQKAIVVTNSTFTTFAIELATRLNCRLIDGSQIPDLILGRLRI